MSTDTLRGMELDIAEGGPVGPERMGQEDDPSVSSLAGALIGREEDRWSFCELLPSLRLK
jgi:hypothetical protein